ncbi:unnamed protein product [Dibothriocephalus latus]|uniref:Uncharacterized protein n=1 Tax=Dibothriocephalus latus TaxID=60516 RepID=A0A3P7NRG9_DIBLA|nr:unnamed protein product [Dibothriocephalus latus]
MLVCTATFLPGGLMQTEFCRYLTNRYPSGPRIIDDTVINIANFVQSSDPNQPHDLRLERLFKMRVAELLLTRCANQTLVDAAGDESIGWMVSNQIDAAIKRRQPPSSSLPRMGKYNCQPPERLELPFRAYFLRSTPRLEKMGVWS